MNIPALLVASERQRIAPTRMPAALARAGFEVSLLAPAGMLVHKSRFVARTGVVPDGADVHAWIFALVATVRATQPAIVIPGDETTLRLLQMVVAAPPPELRPDVALELTDLITRSLGPQEFYHVGTDKGALQPFLERAGIPVPEYAVARSAKDTEAAAHALGRTVVRSIEASGGRGVSVCDTPRRAAQAFRRARKATQAHTGAVVPTSVLVQRGIIGTMITRSSVAHLGVELGGFACERLQATSPTGGATVARYAPNAQLATLSRTVARALQLTGFFAMEYCVEQGTGKVYAIDFARHLLPSHHTGRLVGIDLCAALAAALRGETDAVPELPDSFERTIAYFPQEYWRDPQSTALSRYPIDAPWDDPALLEALLERQPDPDA